MIAHPNKYNKVTASGSAAYINNIKFDKQTGAVADGLSLSLKLDKIQEEEKYDGYYSIVTSELNMSDKELRNKYSIHKIIDAIKNYNSIPIEHDLCLQNYTDEIIEEFQKIFNIDFSRKYLTLSEIKKNFLFYQKKTG